MNEQEKEQFRKGEGIKRIAMALMDLSDGEKAFYNSVPVFGASQDALTKMVPPADYGDYKSDNDYDPAAVSVGDKVFMREKFPYNPKLRFGNLRKTLMHTTEKDVLAHEMQHQFAGRTGRKDTEELANEYSYQVSDRLSNKPNRVVSLSKKITDELTKKGYFL